MIEPVRRTLQDPSTSSAAPVTGLSTAEVTERRGRGETNDYQPPVSRTFSEIVRANVLTRFNLLVGSLVVVMLVVGPVQDAVFGLVLVFNSAIGIVQELRAKRSLDRLALVSTPEVVVLRDGELRSIGAHEVVLGDVMRVGRGDQLVADGQVVDAHGLEVDESLLTGEAAPRAKRNGDPCLSGSTVVAGSALVVTTEVGEHAYAARTAAEARRFELVGSELRADTDRLLRWIGWAMVPTIAVLVWGQVRAAASVVDAVRGAVSGTVGIIPQGLVLLISVAMAVGVARLARLRVLTQDLGALEGLARVDVVCFDKTGTLTEGRLALLDVVPVASAAAEATTALAALAHGDPDPNATTHALATALPAPSGWAVDRFVPFSSARRWSGAEFADRGSWLLGASDAVCPRDDRIAELQAVHTATGRRVLVLARAAGPLRRELASVRVEPAALVVLGDGARGDAADTIRYFEQQGVGLKVISGDDPGTVAAVARAAGIDGSAHAGPDLPDDPAALARVAEDGEVFGRVSPEQKRELIDALRRSGHVVAMVGDGVNDTLALKAADVGVAMGSGSAAARAVAPLVLVDGRFAHMPTIVAEGRRVIGNIERVANLYVTKAVYAFVLAWAVGVAGWAFPLLPRHYTVIGVATVGVPSFWLALERSAARVRPGFLGRVLRFGVPAGVITALAGFVTFWVARAEGVTLEESQALTTLTIVAVGMAVLLIVARPLTPVRKLLVSVMVLGTVLTFVLSPLRTFYALQLPRPAIVLAAVGVVALTAGVMYAALHASGWWRELPTAFRQLDELTGPQQRSAAAAASPPERDRGS